MDILLIAYITNPVLIFLIAIGVGFFIVRKYKLGWRLYFIGGATYLAAQLISIVFIGIIQDQLKNYNPIVPVQLLITLILLLLLMAIEEFFRYAMYRWWIRDLCTWAEGLLLGAGHGGVEVILIGVTAAMAISQLIPLRNADLSTIVSPDRLQAATEYVTNFWSKPWYNTLSDAVRSGLTIPVQIACSLFVLQVFVRKQIGWLFVAIGFHFLANIPLYLINLETYPYLPLVFLAVATAISVWMIFRLQPRQELSV